LTDAA